VEIYVSISEVSVELYGEMIDLKVVWKKKKLKVDTQFWGFLGWLKFKEGITFIELTISFLIVLYKH